jgi:hypothetical protein
MEIAGKTTQHEVSDFVASFKLQRMRELRQVATWM